MSEERTFYFRLNTYKIESRAVALLKKWRFIKILTLPLGKSNWVQQAGSLPYVGVTEAKFST
jgi:hypothetical protein